MRKTFMGMRLQHLRQERGLTQAALARQLNISPSYLNQLEHDQRPLTVAVLLRLNAVFGVDVQMFSEAEEARLIADLREALTDSAVGEAVSLTELRSLATNLPGVARVLVTLQRRLRAAEERLEALATSPDGSSGETPAVIRPPMPYEEVRDYFYDRHNHVAELDQAAEQLYQQANLTIGAMEDGLAALLRQRHHLQVVSESEERLGPGRQRQFEPGNSVLYLARSLSPGQRAFQMATQLAFIEHGTLLSRLTASPRLASTEARALARIGLANYFAGALIQPYSPFLLAAETQRYDIERLCRQFGVGFETVCHRLSTLQRTGAHGVPFFFVRVDRAGNISKRQSATDFHFSRVGGSCPLWNVYEAFANPGRMVIQLAQMPDGRTYLWLARTVSHASGGFGAPTKTFAIGLGCDLRHAGRLVYARGLDLGDPTAATPIGAGCKVCERTGCPQRAFPPIGRPLVVDEQQSQFEPYRTT